MAVKKNIEIKYSACANYSYPFIKSGIKLLQRLFIKNLSGDDIVSADLTITDGQNFILPFTKKLSKIPQGLTIDIDVSDLEFNITSFINLENPTDLSLDCTLSEQGIAIHQIKIPVSILPYNTYSGTDSSPELLSAYINPYAPEIKDILQSAASVLKGWKINKTICGYDNTINEVRYLAAAIFRAIQLIGIEKYNVVSDYNKPVAVKDATQVYQTKKAADIELALIFCAAIEASGLHSVIAIGKTKVLCGVWLRENCFLEPYFEDITELKKRADLNINDIAVIDLDNMYAGGKQNFAGAEKSAMETLYDELSLSYVIDIKRCRISHFKPLPQRIKTKNGYELSAYRENSLEEMPKDIKKDIRNLKVRPDLTREKQWERRLLDLSLKNRLLNFIDGKSVLHVMSANAEHMVEGMLKGDEFSVMEMPREGFAKITEFKSFGSFQNIKHISELVSLEFKNNRIRCFSENKSLTTILSSLYRKDKINFEESGASTLYLAVGFLKWNYVGEQNSFKYAPLLLLPISLIKKSAGKGYAVKIREEEYHFNTTLLEFLKQEFNIELRGLDEIKSGDIASVFSVIRRQILPMKGWEVFDDVYIASLSFSRFLMWNDIRTHIDNFKKNQIINALIEGYADPKSFKRLPPYDPDDIKAKPLFIPISADYSQYGAVAAASSGTSFVLHGPPGTGKSQTITNIIANAVAAGKRVLFVAEKMAALSVVKKRLDEIGIGDFCLELHSSNTPKNEIAAKLLNTVSLSNKAVSDYLQQYEKIKAMKEVLQKPIYALHKKRLLGLSVYEGILKVKQYDSAPDIMDIDSSFLESLTADKLVKYESMLNELILVLQDTGQVYKSPFEDVLATVYENDLSIKTATSIKVLQEEIRHLRAYAELCFEKFGNRIRTLSKTKLETLYQLCKMLTDADNPYIKIFKSNSEVDAVATLNDFTKLYKKFQAQEASHNAVFKAKVDLVADPSLLLEELELYGDAFKKSKALKALLKRMERACKQKINDNEIVSLFKQVISFNETKIEMAKAGDKLSALLSNGKNDKVNYNQVADIIIKLNKLYDTAEKLFVQYDYHSFNKVLKNLFGEYPSAILTSFIKAYDDCQVAIDRFNTLLSITKDFGADDGDYLENITIKAAAIYDNLDLLPSWIRYNNISKKLTKSGLNFAVAALKEGKVSPQSITDCFKKKVYKSFVEREINEDETLLKFSAPSIEEKIERFKNLCEEHEQITRTEIYHRLVKRLPKLNTEGPLSLELLVLQRAVKSNMRGITLRKLFEQINNLLAYTCPCLLMSPTSVAQYLEADANQFDLVIFDEASQMPTSEAIGSIARAKNAIVVGDPKQLPPTTFFSSDYTDEDNLQLEDLESILDDCLALGLPEKHLLWHYRSKHESLIAFSNTLYYDNRLSTFPSPDAMESKVQFRYVENGVYDRGGTRQNGIEADKLISEVIKCLKDKSSSSIGIITFSMAQQLLIENKLSQALLRHRLETQAYEREEPVFVKNLENVQGDERDLIFLSVGYGPDKNGKLSLNFGPLNQSNGWRRLNVAASRAREEMFIYSSMTSAMIDLSKNNSKGVAGLKSLLEFASNGRTNLALKSSFVNTAKDGIGKYIAKDLKSVGLDCRYDLGVSDFKIDVAIVDPRDSNKYILAIICDGKLAYESRSIKDSDVLQITMLKRLNWNVMRIWTANYFNNPKREVKKIKQLVSKLCGNAEPSLKAVNKFVKPYQFADIKSLTMLSSYILDESNDKDIIERLNLIVQTEQPISKEMLIKRCLSSYGILRTGVNINAKMEELLSSSTAKNETLNGTIYYRFDDSVLKCNNYRVDVENNSRRSTNEIAPYEFVAAAKYVLSERISLFIPDLVKEVGQCFGYSKPNAELENAIKFAIDYGAQRGHLIKSVSDMITL